MFYLTSFRSMQKRYRLHFDWREVVPLGFLAILILLFGSFPLLYQSLFPAQFSSFHHVLESLSLPHHGFVHSLIGFLWVSFGGILLIVVGLKKGWFHISIPYSWTALSGWYRLYGAITKFCTVLCQKMDDAIVHQYDAWITYLASPWFLTCQEIDAMFPRQNVQSCRRLTSSCCSFDGRVDTVSSSIVPGKTSWTHHVSEKLCQIDDRVCQMWNQVNKVFLLVLDKSDREDQNNAKRYAFMVSQIGKVAILVSTILTIGIFVLFIVWVQ